jgi:hypothetical protein
MQLKLSKINAALSYKAEYVGYKGPLVNPRLGDGNIGGHQTATYQALLNYVLKDLRGCTEPIQVVFSGDISTDAQEATNVLFRERENHQSLEGRIGKAIDDLQGKQVSP